MTLDLNSQLRTDLRNALQKWQTLGDLKGELGIKIKEVIRLLNTVIGKDWRRKLDKKPTNERGLMDEVIMSYRLKPGQKINGVEMF